MQDGDTGGVPLWTRRHLKEVGPQRLDLPNFIGALRLPFILANFGWPSTMLTLHTEGVVIGPSSFIFRPFVPFRAFQFDDCDIQAIGTFILNRGVRFYERSSGRWVIFALIPRDRLLEILSDLSDDVKPIPERFNLLWPAPKKPR